MIFISTAKAMFRRLKRLELQLAELETSVQRLTEETRRYVEVGPETVADFLRRVDAGWTKFPERYERIDAQIVRALGLVGGTSGSVLEDGGRRNPRVDAVRELGFRYHNMDLEYQKDSDAVMGDITSCPEIPDETYDAVLSVDVFEHLSRPWMAADEIVRILRPGGVCYVSTLFSWRYHPVPIDYWRFSAPCLEYLFRNLHTCESGYDTSERRRDVRGHGRLDSSHEDELGGWRENWRVYYVGQKRE